MPSTCTPASTGRGDLSEKLRPTPPYRHQSLKSRAVLVAARRQPRIAIRNIHAHRTGRRPHRQIHRGLGGGDPQRALGVQQPLPVGFIAPGIHRDRSAARLTRRPPPPLAPEPRRPVHHQRRGQHQLLDDRATDLITGADDQLHKTRPGKQHHPAHHVVGQPRLSRQRQPTGQHHPTGIGPLDHCTQQRMLGLTQTQSRAASAGPVDGRRRPKPLPLKGIRGQLHPPPTRAGEHRRPIDPHPGGEQLTGRAPSVRPPPGGLCPTPTPPRPQPTTATVRWKPSNHYRDRPRRNALPHVFAECAHCRRNAPAGECGPPSTAPTRNHSQPRPARPVTFDTTANLRLPAPSTRAAIRANSSSIGSINGE